MNIKTFFNRLFNRIRINGHTLYYPKDMAWCFIDGDYYEKKLTNIPPRKAIDKKVRILPHAKYTIKTQFYIKNRELFLRTNKNLRLEFYFNDANLGFMEDPMCPRVLSENIIDYKW